MFRVAGVRPRYGRHVVDDHPDMGILPIYSYPLSTPEHHRELGTQQFPVIDTKDTVGPLLEPPNALLLVIVPL